MDVNVLDPRIVNRPDRTTMPAPEGVVPDEHVTRAGLDSDVVVPAAQHAVLYQHVLARHGIDPVRVGTVGGRADVDPLDQDIGRVLGDEVEHGTVEKAYVADVNVLAVSDCQEIRGFDAAVLSSNLPPFLATPIYSSDPRSRDGEVIAVLEVEERFVLRPRGGNIGSHDRALDEEFHVDALTPGNAEGPHEVGSLRDEHSVVACERGAEEEGLQKGLRVVRLAVPYGPVIGDAADQLSVT